MDSDHIELQGLTDEQVSESRTNFGSNIISFKKENVWVQGIISQIKEPMVILLLVTSVIYFLSDKTGDGIFLLSSIILVSTISLYQNSRSNNALEKLKDFSHPKCKVVRNGIIQEIKSEELVIGDNLMIEEGTAITADGIILQSNDFSVNESILTGESLSVYKDHLKEDHLVFHGTTVASGLAIVEVTAIGIHTKLGKIGKSLDEMVEEKTPLELQINDFVKKMIIIGAIVFAMVLAINYFHTYNLLDSLIKALTLAMSILPEEIHVAFTTFMALGAWRLMKIGVLVKQMKTVETLGSASVICTDKTGTITENKMSLAKVVALSKQKISNAENIIDKEEQELLQLAMWASEPIPFDPMEIAIHNAYLKLGIGDKRSEYKMIHEYPLSGKPPMMTHFFENKDGNRIIAAKGAPEALMEVSNLTDVEKNQISDAIKTLAASGYRVLAVGETVFQGNNFPAKQQEFKFGFKGLLAFYDPPKENIKSVIQDFYKAGIAVKILTGDNAETTQAIAQQINFIDADKCIGGEALMKLSSEELAVKVEELSIFTRMFPEAKLKVINALKSQNEIVAMTGDGVNDGPALKAAHIGIAMGKTGTAIAKQAASLILLEDDLSKMVDAVAMGRRIYTNLKKAIQYIISIHIPIILIVFIPLALSWKYPNIFSPLHIIFLELIMGPTCSIIFENEPMEDNAMNKKPRPFTTTFFSWKELITSIIQGLIISAGTLITYLFAISQGFSEPITRTMVFTVLIVSNIFLTLVNRSFYFSILTTIRYKNNLIGLILALTICITTLLIYVEPLSRFFELEPLNIDQLLVSIGMGFLFVIWFEIVKSSNRVIKKQ